MNKRVVHLNLNVILVILLVASAIVSAYLMLHMQGVYSVLREYNSRTALVQSDMNDMSAFVQEWKIAVSYSETYQNYPYLRLISDSYNNELPPVKQHLLDYRDFVGKNSALLVSVSINAPLEIKNIDSLLEAYDKNVGDFSAYLQRLQAAQQNVTAPSG